MSILIEAKRGNTKTVVDEADNRKEAMGKMSYWQAMKGGDWKISTRVVK